MPLYPTSPHHRLDYRWTSSACQEKSHSRIEKIAPGRRGSVSRILSPPPIGEACGHSSGSAVAGQLKRHTRRAARAARSSCRSCSRWGLPSRSVTRPASDRSPFHRFLREIAGGSSLFCGTFPRLLGAVVNGHLRPVESGLSSRMRRCERPPDLLRPGTNLSVPALLGPGVRAASTKYDDS